MALKLNVGVSRKVGLPDYGSVGASCNLELEIDLRPAGARSGRLPRPGPRRVRRRPSGGPRRAGPTADAGLRATRPAGIAGTPRVERARVEWPCRQQRPLRPSACRSIPIAKAGDGEPGQGDPLDRQPASCRPGRTAPRPGRRAARGPVAEAGVGSDRHAEDRRLDLSGSNRARAHSQESSHREESSHGKFDCRGEDALAGSDPGEDRSADRGDHGRGAGPDGPGQAGGQGSGPWRRSAWPTSRPNSTGSP